MLITITLFLTLFSLWTYSISILGQKKLCDIGLRGQNTRLLTIAGCLMPISWLISALFSCRLITVNRDDFLLRGFLIFISIVFCIAGAYMIYFASRTYKTLAMNSQPKFIKIVPVMIGMLFFPIGIWFIQPKINKIIGND